MKKNKVIKNVKKDLGITLIASVVTIIILLILAGISIAILNGDNGLFAKVKLAKEKSKIGEEQESSILKDYESKIEGIRNNSFEESNIVKNFNIIVEKIFSNKITINLAENTSTENIIGYIIFIGDNAVDVTNEMPYDISNLQKNTEYSDIYVVAIDNKGNMKKSNNKLKEKTNSLIVDGLFAYWPLHSNLLNDITENNFIDVKGTAVFEDNSIYLENNSLKSKNPFYMDGNQTTFLQYKRVKEPTSWGMMFGYTDPGTSVYDHRSLYWDAYENCICLMINNYYGQHLSFSLSESLPLNTWVNIAVTTDGSNTIMYINGKKKSTTTLYKYDLKDREICLGSRKEADSPFPGGYYKNFGIVNRALSESELQNLFSSL